MHLRKHVGLVRLDREHEVEPEPEQLLRGAALGVQRVGDNAHAGVGEGPRQDAQRGPFGILLLPAEAQLADHGAGVEVERRELLLGGLVEQHTIRAQIAVIGAAQHLAIHRDGPQRCLAIRAILWIPQHLRGCPSRQQTLHLGGVDALEQIVPTADAGGLVAPGLRAPPGTDRGEGLLAQRPPEVAQLGQCLTTGQTRSKQDRQRGAHRIAQAAAAARVGDLVEEAAQGAPLSIVEHEPGLVWPPGGLRPRGRELLPRVAPQRVDEHALGRAVVPIADRAAAHAPEALRGADLEPVGGAVAGSSEACRIHKRFGQEQRAAVQALPLARQLAQAQAEHARGQMGAATGLAQQQETRLIGHQEQPLAALQGTPADPAVAGGAVQRGGMPADQSQPALAVHGDLAQALATEVAEAEIVPLAHQLVPARLLVGPHRPDPHLAQRKRVLSHVPSYRTPKTGLSSPPPSSFVNQPLFANIEKPWARLQALPQPLRLLLDTLRMLAYRAETAMTTAVAPALDNPDTARSLLKSLFQADASLHPDESAGTLTVRLLHQPTRAQDRALAPLLDELNRTRTVFPGTHLRLVYRMLSDDLPCSASSQPTPANPKPPLPASKLSNPNET